ncbi:polysaccharide pyruvyl transferase [Candidatus Planktophila sulfonica]|uniref:Polysaccharide pyruvyl transferase n=1 Tax=Candidatus Planktophila sulfonica TaxID=1884904 RepID=A0A249KF81_9ACTN|nr:polysaccharide pyruvyl transferase family protein [Candidatus Planktophila sulfonica]ASY15359.1 polysaccharide pyruvyl transferase [Candidatus Planktophila sulfonica]
MPLSSSKTNITVAHLASFQGNFGDVANHLGFRKWFSGLIQSDIHWANIEIRDFYRGNREFDANLVAELNAFDLVVIGGGNYFELWPENTRTGCSIDLPEELLKDIHPPIFFNALGVDDGQGVGEKARRYFADFVKYLYNSDKYLLSLRNDGALQNIRKNFPELSNFNFNVIPDHGFFVLSDSNLRHNHKKDISEVVIGLNLAQDMTNLRFKNGKEQFLSQIRHVLLKIEFDRLILFPHIYSDVEILYELISSLPDAIKREKISLSPLGSHNLDIRTTLENYLSVDLMIAMRFHANVIPLSLGTPTIGISSYPQISNLYADLDIQSWSLDVDQQADFPRDLTINLEEILSGSEIVRGTFQQIPIKLWAQRTSFEPTIKTWLGSHGFS